MRRFLIILLLSVASSFGAPVASATVLVPMSDADLVRSSSVIVTGQVEWIESAGLERGGIVTRIALAVEETVKGRVDGEKVVITEPGGRVGDRTVQVFGAPEFAVGERVLVFLGRTNEGTLRTNALALGKYRIVAAGLGSQRAVRTVPTLEVRRLDEFLGRLAALAGRERLHSSVFSEPEAPDDLLSRLPALEPFTFLGRPSSRWFEPDSGKVVSFLLANSDATLGSEGTRVVVADALAAWTDVCTARITVENGGTGSPARSVAAFGICDDKSQIQFNDPFDAVRPDLDLVGCTGVFAVGGFCATAATKTVGGITFDRIVEADLTVNNGIGVCVSQTDITETVAHEIGHMIGLGHSLDAEALMYRFAHHDGRGAELTDDDILGVSTIYPLREPDGDCDRIPDSRDRCPSTPRGLIIDGNGCACTEPGSAGCDDSDLCTEDACNTTTGACVNDPVDCDDAEPCTVDCCDPATGDCVHELRDSDGDGLCDMLDNCPLQPYADPTDTNGDGVGDVCQCADEKPGRCVPGRGWKERKCILEWLPAIRPPLNPKRLPSVRLRCSDGDPECDEDDVPGQCTFGVALCVDNDDPRLNKCNRSTVDRLVIKSPRLNRLKDTADTANAEVLRTAIETIRPSSPGPRGCGRVAAVRCSDTLPIVVPTGRLSSGSKRLKVRGVTEKGHRARARLDLICKPAREE